MCERAQLSWSSFVLAAPWCVGSRMDVYVRLMSLGLSQTSASCSHYSFLPGSQSFVVLTMLAGNQGPLHAPVAVIRGGHRSFSLGPSLSWNLFQV